MFKASIPLINVRSGGNALNFYCDHLGFMVQSTYRPHADLADPAYHVIARDGAIIHVSSFSGDGVAGGVVTIIVDDIGKLHDELVGRGVDVGTGVMHQTWGNKEVYVTDPDGNKIRFQSGD